jgi:hypothetical protein
MANWPNSVIKFAQAIAKAEGFGLADAIPTIANNPGDLTGKDAGSFPTMGTANMEGVIKFMNLQDGWTALYVKVSRMLAGGSKVYTPNLTLAQVGMLYSGGDKNWATNVAAELGVPETTTLAELKETL